MTIDQEDITGTAPNTASFPQSNTGCLGMPPLRSRLKKSYDLPNYWKTKVSGWTEDTTFGQICANLGDDQNSLFILGRALRQVRTKIKDQYLEVTCDAMISLYVESQKFHKARAVCKQAIRLAEEVYGRMSIPPARYEIQLAGIYYKSGQTVKSLNHAYNALVRLEEIFGACHETLIPLLDKLVFLNHRLGRYKEAKRCGERALELIRNSENPLFEDMAITLHYYLDMIEEQSDDTEGETSHFCQNASNHNYCSTQ